MVSPNPRSKAGLLSCAVQIGRIRQCTRELSVEDIFAKGLYLVRKRSGTNDLIHVYAQIQKTYKR